MSSKVPSELDPTKRVSRTTIRVRFVETDLMGIVHHASYFAYFELGRVEWLRARGITYAEWARKGVHLPVVDAHARYLSPARFDESLVVETTLAELRTVSMRFSYRLLRDETTLAEGATRLGCIDASHKLMRITDDMREALVRGEL